MTDQSSTEKINAANILLKDIGLYEQAITDINNKNDILHV